MLIGSIEPEKVQPPVLYTLPTAFLSPAMGVVEILPRQFAESKKIWFVLAAAFTSHCRFVLFSLTRPDHLYPTIIT